MKRFSNFIFLPFTFQFEICNYFVRRLFGAAITKSQKQLYTLFCDLERYSGKVLRYDSEAITIQFQSKNAVVSLRHFPSSDYKVFTQVFKDEQYKSTLEAYRKNFNQEPECFLDCGGNIGLTSIFFKAAVPNVKICIVEPDTENFKFIEQNFCENNLTDAHLFKSGIWSSDTFLEVNSSYGDGNHWAKSVQETTTDTGLHGISISDLQNRLKWPIIDILKIDIEGAEAEVFNTQKSDLTFLAKTKVLAIEIHEDVIEKQTILDVLDQYNFGYFSDGELTIAYNQQLIL
ncbi:FkbM family methyltransferase [Flavobacterium sp.]|uniref:FkbM family methyltransferase n=1 Tax=Flavobacterium sp. TaxID=239 RepID=UPI0026165FAA|nr:FkbM family methyltransferase [Flavobacterium sp.]